MTKLQGAVIRCQVELPDDPAAQSKQLRRIRKMIQLAPNGRRASQVVLYANHLTPEQQLVLSSETWDVMPRHFALVRGN